MNIFIGKINEDFDDLRRFCRNMYFFGAITKSNYILVVISMQFKVFSYGQ